MSRYGLQLRRGLLDHVPWLLAGLILAVAFALLPALRRPLFWLYQSQELFAPALLALVLTPIVLTGGIDLSVGSIAVFSSVVMGVLLRNAGWPVPAALAAGLLAGLLAGFVNGMLVVLGVLPLVATLATRELFRGLALTLGGDTPVAGLPPELGDLWQSSLGGLPWTVWTIAGLFAVTYFFVHHTWMGRMCYAIGDNETAARFAGVPVRRLKLGLYAMAGLVAGLCGASLVLRYGAAKADAEKTLELTAISCVVLGGIRISGGAGDVAGTLVGIVTVATLLAGLNQVPPSLRDLLLGSLLIIVAVSSEAARRAAARLALQQPISLRPGVSPSHLP
jgi:ribose/xylose/arabinose/galactoside ABC-type transport system permease subunit